MSEKIRRPFKETELGQAYSKDDSILCGELAIKAGADPNERLSEGGNTPLHIALAEGRLDFAQMLFEQGADVNAANSYHMTPLLVAIKKGNLANMNWLLDRSADADKAVSLKNNKPFTSDWKSGDTMVECSPLHMALANNPHLSETLRVTMIDALLKSGADDTVVDKHNMTPAQMAERYFGKDSEVYARLAFKHEYAAAREQYETGLIAQPETPSDSALYSHRHLTGKETVLLDPDRPATQPQPLPDGDAYIVRPKTSWVDISGRRSRGSGDIFLD